MQSGNETTVQKVELDILQKATELNPGRFPIEAFPKVLQKVFKECENSLNYPIPYLGASILLATSLAIGHTHKIEVKKGFVLNAVLYLVIVGRPGTNKSHPLSYAFAPIYKRDEISYTTYKRELLVYEEQCSILTKERTKSGITLQKPVHKKFLVNDYTPEVLNEIHDFNRRGLCVCADEISGWIKNFGRYNKGSEQEFWLSNWSGKPIILDRKGGDKFHISNPFISVGGTIQSGLLNLFSKEDRSVNGFIDRILFVMPDNLQKEYWSENDLDEEVTNKYTQVLNNLLNLNPEETITLKLSPLAKETLFKWQRKNTDLCNDQTSDSIAGIFSKLDIYVGRFALIFQMLRWSCSECEKNEIEKESIDSAIALIEYFRHNALKVHNYIHSSPIDREPENIRLWFNDLPPSFKTSEAVQIGVKFEIRERRVAEHLNKTELFTKKKHGEYTKISG